MNTIRELPDHPKESYKTIKGKTAKRIFKQYVIHSFIIYTSYHKE